MDTCQLLFKLNSVESKPNQLEAFTDMPPFFFKLEEKAQIELVNHIGMSLYQLSLAVKQSLAEQASEQNSEALFEPGFKREVRVQMDMKSKARLVELLVDEAWNSLTKAQQVQLLGSMAFLMHQFAQTLVNKFEKQSNSD